MPFIKRKEIKPFGVRLTETLQIMVTEKEKADVIRNAEHLNISVNQWLRGAIFCRAEVEKMKIEKTPVKGA